MCITFWYLFTELVKGIITEAHTICTCMLTGLLAPYLRIYQTKNTLKL